MLQTNLIGRKVESKLSGAVLEIVAVVWNDDLIIFCADPAGKISRFSYKHIELLDADELTEEKNWLTKE